MTFGRFTAHAVFAYITFVLFFAGIYLFFVQDYIAANRWQSTLLIRGVPISELTVLEDIYFSAITTFTIGYGDITPLGWCKWVAVIEGFCGYLAPTFYVAVGLSIMLNNRYDHMRRIRGEQKVLLELVEQGWELVTVRPDPVAYRVSLTLRNADGVIRRLEMERSCLDFSPWRSGYLSSREEESLQKVEAWLRKIKK
jgi:hypothetical protein